MTTTPGIDGHCYDEFLGVIRADVMLSSWRLIEKAADAEERRIQFGTASRAENFNKRIRRAALTWL
jgi:hypothetical protein